MVTSEDIEDKLRRYPDLFRYLNPKVGLKFVETINELEEWEAKNVKT